MTTSSHQEDLLDEALEETFPASDPPRAFQGAPPARPAARGPWKKLLIATDFSPGYEQVVRAGIDIARASDASVDLVHVREPFKELVLDVGRTAGERAAALDTIDERLADAGQGIIDAGVSCQTTSLQGTPAHEIVSHALKTGADLIVLGSRGTEGTVHALLGNIARGVSRTATCAVLVVPIAAADGK
jgi:nucleotide-binding universal stress UspA family protein